jgi:hypothetical protein
MSETRRLAARVAACTARATSASAPARKAAIALERRTRRHRKIRHSTSSNLQSFLPGLNAPCNITRVKKMNTFDRKAAVAEYKKRKAIAGIYAVRCPANGQVWVGRTLIWRKSRRVCGLA